MKKYKFTIIVLYNLKLEGTIECSEMVKDVLKKMFEDAYVCKSITVE